MSMAHVSKLAEWTEVATAVNAEARATHAAVPRMRHYITGVSISASAAPLATVSALVESADTVKDRFEIPAAVFAPIVPNYNAAIRCGINELAEIILPALGASVRGTVSIKGYTRAE